MHTRFTPVLYIALLILISTGWRAAYSQSSGPIVSPQVWLRADHILQPDRWDDVSGHDRHVSLPAVSAIRDTLQFNYNPTRRFEGGNGFGQLPYSLEGLSEYTFFVVYQPGDTTERLLLSTLDAVERPVVMTTHRVLGPDSVTDIYEAGNRSVTLTTVTQSWEEESTTQTAASLTVAGQTGSAYKSFKGPVAELLIFDEVLPFLHKVQYESYLGLKYGISLQERNYVSSSGQVLWRYDEESPYQYHITGIGRDDHFGLYQRQASSSSDSSKVLRMSLGAFTKENATNPSTLPDQHYVLWGDNGSSLALHKGEGPDSVLSILDRRWQVTSRGEGMNNQGLQLEVDLSQFPADSVDYWLVIDRSGTANFSIDNLEYVQADSVSEAGIAYYHDLHWDADGSGQDHFSFARIEDLFAVVRTVQSPQCDDPASGIVRIDVLAGTGPYEFHWTSNRHEQEIEPLTYRGQDSLVINNLTAGDYTLRVRDSRGLTFTRGKQLTVSDGLPIELGPDRKLTTGQPVTLDASSSIPEGSEVTYAWESSFGQKSSGPQLTVEEAGVYRVYVTNLEDGCVVSDEVAVKGAISSRYSIYPNVVSREETFNVSISLKNGQPVTLRFFDLKGNLHGELSGTGSSEYQFRPTLSQPGHYLVVLETSTGSETQRIVVY